MIIIPRESPIIANLSSYYLDIKKVFEHYQGEFDSGGIHFKSPYAEGMIFFDKDELLTGIFQGKEGEIRGKSAIDSLMKAAVHHCFVIDIHKISAEQIYFWANMSAARIIYEGLSTEFSDLEGLIKKMGEEKLSGYINVSIANRKEDGLIFFDNGKIVGGSYSWGKGKVNPSRKNNEILIQKAKQSGATFDVGKIFLTNRTTERESRETREEVVENPLRPLEELLIIFERTVMSEKNIRTDFSTLLKKKFIQQVGRYDFLDPFAAEFQYSDHKISFVGDAGTEYLINGVVESVKELAEELNILPKLVKQLDPWFQKHGEGLAEYGISF